MKWVIIVLLIVGCSPRVVTVERKSTVIETVVDTIVVTKLDSVLIEREILASRDTTSLIELSNSWSKVDYIDGMINHQHWQGGEVATEVQYKVINRTDSIPYAVEVVKYLLKYNIVDRLFWYSILILLILLIIKIINYVLNK